MGKRGRESEINVNKKKELIAIIRREIKKDKFWGFNVTFCMD